MKKSIKTSLVLVGILFMALAPISTLLAQPIGFPENPSQAPIDGGLSMLAIAGGAYALKKMREKK